MTLLACPITVKPSATNMHPQAIMKMNVNIFIYVQLNDNPFSSVLWFFSFIVIIR